MTVGEHGFQVYSQLRMETPRSLRRGGLGSLQLASCLILSGGSRNGNVKPLPYPKCHAAWRWLPPHASAIF